MRSDPPWSFSVVEDKARLWGNQHPYFESATVRVARVSDGVELVTSNHYSDTDGFGVPNVFSWYVWKWEYDTLYEVEISNVAMQSGETQSFSYEVFIERDNLER